MMSVVRLGAAVSSWRGISPRMTLACRRAASLAAAHETYTLALVILLIWSYIFHDYFLFDKIFIFDYYAVDTISQFYPIEYFRVKHLLSGHIPFWSFQFGLGENVYNLTAGLNPFNIIYLAFGADHIAEAIAFVILLKFLAAALFFHAFLQKLNFSKSLAFFGALAYTFSGYMVLNSHWYHYPNYAVFAAMFLYFFELWFQQKIWLPLVLLVGLLSIKLELQILHIGFFGFFYVLYRCVNQVRKPAKVFFLYIKLISFYFIGIAIWSYFLLPDVYRYFYSDRVKKSFSTVTQTSFIEKSFDFASIDNIIHNVARFFSPDALFSWLFYHGSINYFEDSTLYIGIAAFLFFFVPLVIREKNMRMLWIFPLISMIIIGIPYIKTALLIFISHSFKHLSFYCSFYALFTFIVILQKFFYGKDNEKFISKIKKISFVILIIITISSLYLVKYKYIGDFKINLNTIAVSIAFSIIFCVSLLTYNKKNHIFIRNFLLALLIVEIVISSRVVAGSIPGQFLPFFEKRQVAYFNKDTKSALDYIKKIDASFFRIEKNYSEFSLNDALIQNYFGTTSYLAFPGQGKKNFYQAFNLSRSLLSYSRGLEDHKNLQNLLAVKYFLQRRDLGNPVPSGFSYLRSFGNIDIYRNEHVHSFGRMFYHQISPKAFQQLSLEERNRITSTAVVSAEAQPGIARASGLPAEHMAQPDEGDALLLTHWDEEHFVGDITTRRPGLLFFPVPHDPGWHVQVDGREERLLCLDFAFSGLALTTPGRHHVELIYRPPFMILGLALTGISLLLTLLLWWRHPRIAAY